MHLALLKTNREAAEADPLVTIAGGGGVTLLIQWAIPGGRPISRLRKSERFFLEENLRSEVASAYRTARG